MTRASNILNDTFTKEDQLRLSPEERTRVLRQIEREVQSRGEEEVRSLLRRERARRDSVVVPADQGEKKPDLYSQAAIAMIFATIESSFNPQTGAIDEDENEHDVEFAETEDSLEDGDQEFGWGSPFPDPKLVKEPRPTYA